MDKDLFNKNKLLTKQEFLNSGYFKDYNIVTADVLNEHYNQYVLEYYGYK